MRLFAAMAFLLIGFLLSGVFAYAQMTMTNSTIWAIVPAGYPKVIAELIPLGMLIGTIYCAVKIAIGKDNQNRRMQ
jgi:lipopolysaccharide export LptBFGC system permease protein LptF